MSELRVGLIGSGFMGRSHALALRMAPAVFELPLTPVLEMLADIDAPTAIKAAANFGFARSTGDWRALIADPHVDLIDITAPNHLHMPMAMAAIEAGKPVYCEKPLTPTTADARAMADAAEAAGVKTMVGFNYLKNPMTRLARDIVASGEIGEIRSFRGIHAEDYMGDPDAPWTWRLDPAGGAGVIADLGSHIISLARFVVGPIDAVCADVDTVIGERPLARGGTERRKVEVTDQARALVRFAGGAKGTIEASWVATGRKMYLAFELTGSKGSISLNMERMSEMTLHHTGQAAGKEGFRTIVAGPEHDGYSGFCPAPGHQLGFNDIKTIEVRDLVNGLASGNGPWPDFREAAKIQAVVDAVLRSASEERWVKIAEI